MKLFSADDGDECVPFPIVHDLSSAHKDGPAVGSPRKGGVRTSVHHIFLQLELCLDTSVLRASWNAWKERGRGGDLSRSQQPKSKRRAFIRSRLRNSVLHTPMCVGILRSSLKTDQGDVMGKINIGRVVVGGIVAGIVMDLFGYLVDGLLLAQNWSDDMILIGKRCV